MQHHFRFDDPFEGPSLQRVGDQYLMHAFALQHYKPKELAMINQCRMFLKVITLADITTANGKSLHPWSYKGIQRQPHLHRYHWPRQPKKLSEAHWQLWRKALDDCFRPSYATARDMHLHHPLDDWLVEPTQWPWLHNTTTNKLYHREGLLYQEFSSQARRFTRHSTYSKVERTNWNHPDPNQRPVAILPPGQYQVVDAYKRFRGNNWYIKTSFPYTAPGPPAPVPPPTTLQESLQQLPETDKWAAKDVVSLDDGHSIALEIISGMAIGVSDGSYKVNFGTSAFIFVWKVV
jgi:hypothetical protein